MVGQEVQTTLKVAMREDVYKGCAEKPDTAANRMLGRQYARFL